MAGHITRRARSDRKMSGQNMGLPPSVLTSFHSSLLSDI